MASKTFILGAGFSAGAGFPLVSGLKEDVIRFIQKEKHPSWDSCCESGFHGYPDGPFYAGLNDVDPERQLEFEELLLNLNQRVLANNGRDPWHSTQRILRNGCGRLLWNKQRALAAMPTRYLNFASWMYELHDCNFTNAAISFNWDLVIEKALERCGIHWSYSVHSSVPILKPHGSINWSRHLQEGLTSNYPCYQPISKDSPYCFIPERPFVDPFANGPGKNLRHMTFPGDPEDEQGVSRIWKEAAQAIREREEVVFIGYSLPDYDQKALEFFRTNIEDKPVSVYVRSHKTLERYRQLLKNVRTTEPEDFEDCPYVKPCPDSASFSSLWQKAINNS